MAIVLSMLSPDSAPSPSSSLYYSRSIQSIVELVSSGSNVAIDDATRKLKDVSASLASHGHALSRYDLEAFQKKVIELSHALNEKLSHRPLHAPPRWKTGTVAPKPAPQPAGLAPTLATYDPSSPANNVPSITAATSGELMAHLSRLVQHRHFDTEQSLTLHDISDATLVLSGRLSNVFITELHRTTLDLSQCRVSSSILVRNCQDLVLCLHSCSQLRFSACSNCSIEPGPGVHNIMLETCTGLFFSAAAEMPEKIVDFDWPRTDVPSPNWSYKK